MVDILRRLRKSFTAKFIMIEKMRASESSDIDLSPSLSSLASTFGTLSPSEVSVVVFAQSWVLVLCCYCPDGSKLCIVFFITKCRIMVSGLIFWSNILLFMWFYLSAECQL